MAKIDRLMKQVQEHLNKEETVHAVVMGTYKTEVLGSKADRTGVFIAADNRLVFFAKKLIGFDLESFPYSNISSIEMSKGLTGNVITFYSSGNKVSMKWINQHRIKDVKGFVDHIKNNMGKKNEETASQDDIPTQIKKLSELREQGILTDEEFTTKKQELLKKL